MRVAMARLARPSAAALVVLFALAGAGRAQAALEGGDGPVRPVVVDTSRLERWLAEEKEHDAGDEAHNRARPLHVVQYEDILGEIRGSVPDAVHANVNAPHRAGMDPPAGAARKLQSAADIRVVASYDLSATTTATANHIQNTVMPEVLSIIKGFVQVNAPVSGNLFLPRQCNQYWPTTGDSWTGECATVTNVGTCGNIANHNADYFGSYTLYPNQPSTNGGQ